MQSHSSASALLPNCTARTQEHFVNCLYNFVFIYHTRSTEKENVAQIRSSTASMSQLLKLLLLLLLLLAFAKSHMLSASRRQPHLLQNYNRWKTLCNLPPVVSSRKLCCESTKWKSFVDSVCQCCQRHLWRSLPQIRSQMWL